LTDAELRHRATLDAALSQRTLTVEDITRRNQQMLRDVDTMRRKPAESDILKIAMRHKIEPKVVEVAFEFRRDRIGHNRRSPHRRPDCWKDSETRLITSMWAERNGETLDELLSNMATALCRLRVNQEAGITRTPSAVDAQRLKMKLSLSRREVEERRRRNKET
jgi:hypothetical protein